MFGTVTLVPAAFSVNPYPSHMFTPSAIFKKSRTSALIGADPVTINFKLPPSKFFSFLNIILLKQPCEQSPQVSYDFLTPL